MMKKKMSRRTFSSKTMAAVAGTSLLSPQLFSKDQTTTSKSNEYDYIVVGSGAGGGPLACNLARHGFKVLVLEAGKKDTSNYINEVPGFHATCSEDEEFSWHYYVKHYSSLHQAQHDSKYVEGKGIFYPRGGTVGGSTINNAMITVLPHDSDFDYIAELTGDESWKAENMKKYRAILDNSFYLNFFNTHDIPTSSRIKSWLSVRYPDLLGPAFDDIYLLKIILANLAHNKMSFWDFLFNKHLFNPNTEHFTKGGVGPLLIPQNTSHSTGKRHAVREYLLQTAEEYPNHLHIESDALVTKIITKNKKAIGATYLSGPYLYQADPKHKRGASAKRIKVYAKKEVILAAGAFNSPQLLKLSGIGPKRELQKHNIKLVHDLPGVGENLQDRYEVGLSYQFNREVLSYINQNPNDPELHNFYTNGTGAYSSNGAIGGSIIKTDANLNDPDLFNFALLGAFKGYAPGYSQNVRKDKSILTWAILKGHTDNVGNVLLKNKNPRATPEINFKYFQDGENYNSKDMNALIKGVKNIRSLMNNLFVRPYLRGEVWPGKEVSSDNDIKNFIKNEAWGHHASCSNKIGSDADNLAVLDSKFRVRGIQNLRVVDASVFPKIPGFFISMPIYMISEKATDDILATAGKSRTSNFIGNFFKNRNQNVESKIKYEKLRVTCYPNPFKEKLQFHFKDTNLEGEAKIFILDDKGNLVKDLIHPSTVKHLEIDVTELKPGLYVYLIMVNGQELSGKLLKNKDI